MSTARALLRAAAVSCAAALVTSLGTRSTAAWTGSTWRDGTWTGSHWRDAAGTGSTWRGSTWGGSTWRSSCWTRSRSTGGYADASADEVFPTACRDSPPWHERIPGERRAPRRCSSRRDGCVRRANSADVVKRSC